MKTRINMQSNLVEPGAEKEDSQGPARSAARAAEMAFSGVDPKKFWERVEIRGPEECWEWTLCRTQKGYGRYFVCGAECLAHRLAFTATYGIIPDGLLVCHKCDNPPCCNPSHMFIGTCAENLEDCRKKGRKNQAVGERIWKAVLTEEQVYEIRSQKGLKSTYVLGREYGIAHSAIFRILSGKSWKHLIPKHDPAAMAATLQRLKGKV